MVISKRNFLKSVGTSVLAVATLAPLKVEITGVFPSIASQAAFAKNENGNGKGNGNGGGNGKGSGNGDGGGNGGGNGNGGGSGNGNNGGGNSRSGTSGSGSTGNTPAGTGTRATEDAGSSIDIRHKNGITETLRGGRYIMRDSKGRTIVNRRATSSDSRRLTQLLR